METILIAVKDKAKMRLLRELLRSLDFVEIIDQANQTGGPPAASGYPLRGTPVQYKNLFTPVAEADWGILE